MVRLRFAPSPTGYLHIGGLRTALFSYLYARQQKGKFIFRLEDTDQNRLVEDAEENLLKILDWAGLDIDEGPHVEGPYGPYKQSERLTIYKDHVQKLLVNDHAYYCFCTSERLDKLREEQRIQGLSPKYDGHCRNLAKKEIKEKLDRGEPYVIRMKIPENNEKIDLPDLIRESVTIETDQLDDQILLKTDGFPTYHLAMAVDDHLMKITHVVRGEEWLPSYPKHLLLFRFFGWEPPQFAHIPLILNKDRGKLSKRQGDVAVEDFRAKGYLPEALINFVALLGWNTSDDQEIFSKDELIEKFSFERVVKAGAVFDLEKLNWMNSQYIKALPLDLLYNQLTPFIEQTDYSKIDEEKLKRVVKILQSYLVTLKDVQNRLSLFFSDKLEFDSPEVKDILAQDSAKQVLEALKEEIEQLDEIEVDAFMKIMKKVQKTTKIKGKNLWLPARCALTLEPHGPDLAQVAEVFGPKKCIDMINKALAV